MKKLYKISCALALTALTTGAAFAQEASISSISPTPGTSFGKSDTSGITIFFMPADVTIGSAQVVYTAPGETNTTTRELSCSQDEYRPGNPWEIGLMDNLLWTIATQQTELGSTFQVILEDVNYNGTPVTSSAVDSEFITFEDGNIILTYTVPDVIFALTKAEWPSVFYAEWPMDVNSKAVLTFNEDIATIGNVSYRNDNAEYGQEGGNEDVEFGDFPADIVTIEGNTITIDFADQNLVFIYPTTIVSIYVTGVQSVTGQDLSSVPTAHISYVDNEGTTGIGSIGEIMDSEVSYFNLQGMKVNEPVKGQILIQVKDGKASKVMMR